MSENETTTSQTSVHLGVEKWAELFENINLAEQMIPGQERREHKRVDYRAEVNLYVELEEDGSMKRYLVRTRNISASGLGFIHCLELPLESKTVFTVFDHNGEALTLAGTVARADLIESDVWDIGVRFDSLVDLSDLFAADCVPLMHGH